jgi:Protein of unknown function, DUF547
VRPLAKILLPLLLLAGPAVLAAAAPPPDYKPWQDLLSKHYDPARGMNYKALKADKASLDRLRRHMAQVDANGLAPKDRLAYWINLYNISVVGIVVDHYPVDSIRDISTDPIIRLNVFKKDSVATKAGKISLDTIENEKIRQAFKDPRIHFAINCAAKSCPPIRPEPFVGARIDQQLDDQVRKFLSNTHNIRFEKNERGVLVHVTKIMDWFKDDFENWGGGRIAFLHKYLGPERQKIIDPAKGNVTLEFNDYSWDLNDTSR